jgi:mono/diheme cytochrome c family protein
MKMHMSSATAIIAIALALTAIPAFAADTSTGPVTFYQDVLPIIQENCQECHRPNGANMGGMIAPMAFISYKETRPWAKAIAKTVSTRKMPPWQASTVHAGVFQDERVLTQEQIDTVVKWTNTGARAGNPSEAPAEIEWPESNGWSLGEPDLIVSMPEAFFVDDDLYDETYNFPMTISKDDFSEERWIRASEFRPGSSAVHHIIAIPFGGIAPGNKPNEYREGYGAKLKVDTKVTWNMHYHKEAGPGTGVWDHSSVGVYFYPKGYTPDHVLTMDPLGTFKIKIPAHEANYKASAQMTFPTDALINSMMPHMHLRAKAAHYQLLYPDGREELLLDVPAYDFNWQTAYKFVEPKRVPKGTKVIFTGTFDNSAENPYNPNPNVDVTWGEGTDEEMLFGWLSWTDPDAGIDAPSGIRSESGAREQNQSDDD